MIQKLILSVAFACLLVPFVGCGSGEPYNVSQDADQQAIDDYKAAVAAEEAANSGSESGEAPRPE